MGHFSELSMTPDNRPFSDEGWSVGDRKGSPLPEGCRIAHYSEAGWSYKTPTRKLWITDAPPCERCGGNHPIAACQQPAPTEATTPHLTTCPRCGHPAQHEETPNGEGYTTCGHCAGITFDQTGEEDEPASEFYAAAQAPIDIPSVLEVEDSPPFAETECAICYSLQRCYDDGEAYVCTDRPACNRRQAQNADPNCTCSFSLTDAGWIKRRACAVCKPPAPTPLSPVEALRLALERGVFGLPETVARLRAALAAADADALLRAEQLAAERQHAAATWKRWQEERAAGSPF